MTDTWLALVIFLVVLFSVLGTAYWFADRHPSIEESQRADERGEEQR